MNPDSHLSSLEDKIKELKDIIEGKQKQINLIKTGIDMDKNILKIYLTGLEKLKEQQ